MKRIGSALILIWSLAAAACGVTLTPPSQPGPGPTPSAQFTERTLAVHVQPDGKPIAGCAVELALPLSGELAPKVTDAGGYAAWLVRIPSPDPGGGLNARVAIRCADYFALEDSFVIAAEGNQDITFGGGAALGNQATLRAGPIALPPAFPFPDEVGAIHVDGATFRDEANRPWGWRGATHFMLLARYLRGEDIGPALVDARSHGWNVLRVFGRVAGSGWPDFADFAAPEQSFTYATQLGAFFDLLAAKGLRVEIVPLTYADDISVQRARLQQTYDVAAGRWNVFVEGANEPEVNGIDIVTIYQGVNRRGVVSAYGTYDLRCTGSGPCTLPMLDYVTTHTSREAEWMRKVKDLLELRDGFGGADDPAQWFLGTKRPTVGDEPMGADEFDQPGRRSASVSDFEQAFGVCVIYSAGCTFHSQAGLRSQSLGPVQITIADGIAGVWKFIPPAAQLGRYTRGGLEDLPVAWGGENASMRHYGVIASGDAWVVVVRPAPGTHVVPAAGWQLAATAAAGAIAHLIR
jgi:hypothetical protein